MLAAALPHHNAHARRPPRLPRSLAHCTSAWHLHLQASLDADHRYLRRPRAIQPRSAYRSSGDGRLHRSGRAVLGRLWCSCARLDSVAPPRLTTCRRERADPSNRRARYDGHPIVVLVFGICDLRYCVDLILAHIALSRLRPGRRRVGEATRSSAVVQFESSINATASERPSSLSTRTASSISSLCKPSTSCREHTGNVCAAQRAPPPYSWYMR